MNTSIELMVVSIFKFLKSCYYQNVEGMCIADGLELKGIKNSIQSKIDDWLSSTNGTKYLEFKVITIQGLYIRLNRSNFNFVDDELKAMAPQAMSFYHRQRSPGRKHSKMTLISHLLKKGLDDKIYQHINAFKLIKQDTAASSSLYAARPQSIPTLAEFLPTYESLMYLNNPETANARVQLINNQFSAFFDTPVNYIRGAELIDFIESFKRKRTAVEIQENASRFIVEESTVKGFLGGIRGLLQRASKYSKHPFDLCKSIYCEELEFNIDNESDRYLTLDEIEKLINCLAQRDKEKIKKNSDCNFSDYLTPLILLCLSTGLRPKYALKLKWSHVDFEIGQIIVKGGNGKIKKDKISDLTDEAVLVLKEWKKHVIHKNVRNNWVFPSPQKPKKKINLKTEAERQAEEERLANHNTPHLTSYKNAFTTFRKKYNLKGIVMYDMRHTFATYLTKAYKNIHTTQNALHHADLRSTERYSRHLPSDRKDGIAALAKEMPTFVKALKH